MAIGFARLEFVKRSAGKNAVTKAAYTAKLKLEFEGNRFAGPCIYDWTGPNRGEKPISHSVLLPKHVDENFKDPQKIWNACEQFEKRKDSQVGYDVLLALPDDKIISNEQRIDMAHKFADKYFVSKGYGVQVDVHPPSQRKSYLENENEDEKNERNWHAHLLITTRKFTENGKTFVSKKTTDLLPQVRGNTHFAFEAQEWKKIWTQFQNEYFENLGLDLRVDQCGVVSQVHLGPLRMRGEKAYEILDLNERREELGKLMSQDPEIILKKLTENKSIFSEVDVEIFLQKNIAEKDLEQVKDSFWKNAQIVQLYDKESQQATPKFSSLEVFEEERKILRLANRIHQRSAYKTKSKVIPTNLNKEQQIAFNRVSAGQALSCIEGLAGAGKSYLLVALKEHYESNGYKVRAFGPDNATVKVLQSKGFTDVCNVPYHLFKNYFSKKRVISQGNEVWLVDESSKLGNRSLLELLKLAETNNIQIIFAGNSAQLSSVDRGGMFSVLCNQFGYALLKDVQRQNSQTDREISKRLAFGDVATAINMIAGTGGFIWCKNKEQAILNLVDKWAEDSLNFPYSSRIIIAQTNKEVRQLNDLVHTVRMARGEVSDKEYECETMFGKIRVSEGDFIEFRDNHKKLNVFNGDKGVLVSAKENKFVVSVGGRKVSFNPKKYTLFQLAYATTNFRSQGGEYDQSYLLYSSLMDQKLLYVGRTRHVRKTHCFVAQSEATCLMDLKRNLMRKPKVENTIQYTTEAEIQKSQKKQQREQTIQEMCGSDSLLSRVKGHGFKFLDSVVAKVGSLVENATDRKSDGKFYKVSNPTKQERGRVVQIKEEKIILKPLCESKIENNEQQKPPQQSNQALQKRTDHEKQLFMSYFEKSQNCSSLHAFVQAEARASSSTKENAQSFETWQKACGERNLAAYALLRGGKNLQAVLGKKGLEILQEQAARHELASQQPKDSIDTQLKENIENLLYKLFPEGPQRKDSKGFRFGSKGSLSVTCVGEKKGCYHDFEKKEGGGLLSLIQQKVGLDYRQAKKWANDFLEEHGGKQAPAHFSVASFKAKEDNWISLMPPSNAKPPSFDSLSQYLKTHYNLVSMHPYHNQEGHALFYTLRLNSKEDGKKIVLPLSYGKSHSDGTPFWNIKGYSKGNIFIYNAHLIQQHPEKPVLIVEGEKTADAAQKLLGNDYVVVSWLGGAAAAKEANWNLLSGRNVVIWPDNDAPGFKAATDIELSLKRVGINSLKVINKETLQDFPQKWDLADPLPENKSSRFIQDTLLRAQEKAISMKRISNLASRHGFSFEEMNKIVCGVDQQMRGELEKLYGFKTKEIEASILAEAIKQIPDKTHSVQAPTTTYNEKKIQKEHSATMSLEL